MNPDSGSVAEYIAALAGSERFGPQIAGRRRQPAAGAQTAAPPAGLAPALGELLDRAGIDSLYSHQAEAVELILDGKNVVAATPTASGKSLIYNLPVFNSLLRDPSARALYLFPLKALAQDQLRTIEAFAAHLPGCFRERGLAPAAIYDGDTSAYRRRKIRENLPAILVTNPEMVHLSLLPYHDLWGSLFANLTHVVIDEVHTYRGVFGSHMAWVIRRLKRICRLYGSSPVFILASATIGNPGELAAALIDETAAPLTVSGAPRPPRNMILLNPLDSAPYTATLLLEAAIRRGLRTIVYTQSRKMTELITMWAARRIGDLKDKIASYRAGFLPEDRRAIEQRLADGTLLGVISTSALELGIDIGSLDICLLVGYPGSIMATLQRAGRVGRGRQESLVVLIGHEDALDQHFMRHPEDFFSRDVEAAVLNPDNRTIAGQHLVCAAAEAPLTAGDRICSPSFIPDLLAGLTRKGSLLSSADGETWFAARKYPQRDVDLRGGGARYRILHRSGREELGEIDGFRAFKDCHPGAVYLHMARSWLVDHLDIEGREIAVSPFKGHYFTRPLSTKTTTILQIYDSRTVGGSKVHFGRLQVTEVITGYLKILIGSQRVIGRCPLDLPPQVFETEGFWLEIPESLMRRAEQRRLHFMGGIHALEHAMIAMLPLLVLCDRNDIGGISHPWHQELEGPAVFIYDGHSGGVGLTAKAFSLIDRLLERTLAAVRDCSCELGCPSCVHSPKCGSGNRPIDKQCCLDLLEGLMRPGEGKRPGPPAGKRIHLPRPECAEATAAPPFTLPQRFGVFDVETKRSAQDVGGWHQAERMGVSLAVLYDGGQDRFFSYPEEETDRLIDHLFSLELVIGFNNKRFDNRVLSAYTTRKLARLPTLDLLEEITVQLGYRLSLDRLAEHTLNVKKEGNGLLALQWFQEGRMDLLAGYCRKDVEITRDLFLFGLRERYLLFRNKAGSVVRLPVDFQRRIGHILNSRPAPDHGQTSFR
ncbi:MAG: DEAD/DEAH box helicase [Desulfobulbaceae bacterium]|jgi:DEAD/DEAH box helicase domain-containing protein|nr:DEAD/DEAH box helicase [Desulfobulbaceae bacterium]